MKFYIDGLEIEQPQGINGLYLGRKRDSVFGGFVRQRIANVKGIGEITIKDEIICQILKLIWEQYGYDAVLPFEIRNETETIYLAEVDFGQYSVNHNNEATISFRDTDPMALFNANIDNVVELEATDTIWMPKTNLTGKTTHSTPDKYKILASSRHDTFTINSTVPLKVSQADSVGDGIGLDTLDADVISPFWKNNSEKIIRVNLQCLFQFTAQTEISDTIKIIASTRQDGLAIETFVLYTFTSTSTQSVQNVVINKMITVPVWGDLILTIQGTNAIKNYKIEFSIGQVSIEEDLDIQGSYVKGLFLKNAMSQLIGKASSTMTLINDAYKDSNLFITNGYNLRASSGTIKTSFTELFKGMSKIDNLVLNIEENVCKLEKKEVNYKNSIESDLSNIAEIETTMTTTLGEIFVNQIEIGYQNWKSETTLGNQEFNSTRVYKTSINKAINSVNKIVTEFITAGSIIEKTRRIQYLITKSSDSTDSKYDDTIFLIDTDGANANVGINGLNEALNPMVSLSNLEIDYGHCKAFNFVTGEGNVTAEVNGEQQNKSITTTGYFTGRNTMIECSMNLEDYLTLGNFAIFNSGGIETKILIDEDTYRLQTNKATITGREIK